MSHAYFLDELQLEEFCHGVSFANAENVGDDVLARVTQPPKVIHYLYEWENEAGSRTLSSTNDRRQFLISYDRTTQNSR